MRACVIGLGKLGLPVAEVMAEHHDVVGYDIKSISNATLPVYSSLEEAIQGRELIFVAIQTPHDSEYGGEYPTSHLPPKDFDYSYVTKLMDDLNKIVSSEQIVVLISTTLPGTVRNIIKPHLTNCRFLYNPYLIAMGTVKHDMKNPEMVIIGSENDDKNDGDTYADLITIRAFYKPIIAPGTRFVYGTWDEAESIKIFYNTWISTKLGLVNMMMDVAEKSGHINVDVVTTALAESTQRIMSKAYTTAGMGDSGGCHPRDNIALRHLSEKLDLGYDLFGAIMSTREAQAKNIALTALQYSTNVVILGRAYKPGVAYTEGSYSTLIGHYISELGGTVDFYDPRTNEDFAWTTRPAKVVYIISFWDDWTMDYPIPDGSIVLDPWRKYPKKPGLHVVHYGNTR